MFDYLNSIDWQVFLFINQMHNGFFDLLMYWLSDKIIWIPLYLFIIYLLIREYKQRAIALIISAILVIVLCDQITSGIIKPLVHRLRPSHNPEFEAIIHLSKAGKSGLYGFVSSHAANSFGLASFVAFTLSANYKLFKHGLFTWATLVSYSRIYNGVHYPGDVICGGLIGILCAWAVYKLYKFLQKKEILKR